MGKIGAAILARPALAIAIIVSALSGAGLLLLFATKGSFATDFSVYWRAANEPLSMAYLPRDELPFPYPPTMLLWIAPLALVPMWSAFTVWVAGSALAFWLACRKYLTPAASTLAILSPPLVNGLGTGQVSAMIAAVMLWACGTSNRIAAGAALAVAASIKPQLVIMAPLLWVFNRDGKAFLAAVAVFCLILAASLYAYGLDTWFVWANSLDNFRHVLHAERVLGVAVSPAAAAENYGLPALPAMILGGLLGAWLVFHCRKSGPLAQSAALACGSLLAAPYALTYDLAAVIPFMVWAVFNKRISAAVAIAGALHPIPLALTAWNLLKSNDETETSMGCVEPVYSGNSRAGVCKQVV